ncbi:hypothetical protein PENTCL1PPCAC_19048, partial [Pristionchus entomophagus]
CWSLLDILPLLYLALYTRVSSTNKSFFLFSVAPRSNHCCITEHFVVVHFRSSIIKPRSSSIVSPIAGPRQILESSAVHDGLLSCIHRIARTLRGTKHT